MTATVTSFEDSLGVKFPKSLLKSIPFSENDDVEILVKDNGIIIQLHESPKRFATNERNAVFAKKEKEYSPEEDSLAVQWKNYKHRTLKERLAAYAEENKDNLSETELEEIREIINSRGDSDLAHQWKNYKHRTLKERLADFGSEEMEPFVEYDWGKPVGNEVW